MARELCYNFHHPCLKEGTRISVWLWTTLWALTGFHHCPAWMPSFSIPQKREPFLNLFLFFTTLTALRSVWCFGGWLSIWVCLIVFSEWNNGVEGRIPPRWRAPRMLYITETPWNSCDIMSDGTCHPFNAQPIVWISHRWPPPQSRDACVAFSFGDDD